MRHKRQLSCVALGLALLLPAYINADQLLLKHMEQTQNPQEAGRVLSQQLIVFGGEAFRQQCIEALRKQGFKPADAASVFDAVTIRYNVKTRDIYLGNADERVLRIIAGCLLESGARVGVEIAMQEMEDARVRGDTAFLEGRGSHTGGHASLFRIVGMVPDSGRGCIGTAVEVDVVNPAP